jgi:lysozyme family protein
LTFERALEFVLSPRHEGTHSTDPADPGGDTWYGISRVANPDMPWPPTKEQAAARYRERYWDACSCDRFPWPVALALFDTAVQHSPSDAIRWLQSALGVNADGVVGPITVKAGWAATREQLADVLVYRAIRVAHQPAFWKFAKGWMRRLFDLHQEVLLG